MKQGLFRSIMSGLSRLILLCFLVAPAMVLAISLPSFPYSLPEMSIADRGTWGFIDKSGKLVITPQFDSGGSFFEGKAFVGRGQHQLVLIDRSGKQLFNTRFNAKRSLFCDGLSAVAGPTEPIGEGSYIKIPAQKFSFIDNAGKKWSSDYDNCLNFKEGKALVLPDISKMEYEIVDKVGHKMCTLRSVPCTFSLSEGLLSTKLSDKCGFSNAAGKIVIAANFDKCRSFKEGLAAVAVEKSGGLSWGFIDHAGRLKIPYRFKIVGDFSEGLARFSGPNALCGFVNKSGTVVISSKDSNYNEVSDSVATFAKDGRFGAINKSGKVIISPKFENAGNFKEGMCPVSVKVNGTEKWGYINSRGAWIVEPSFSAAQDFSEGLAAVRVFKNNQ